MKKAVQVQNDPPLPAAYRALRAGNYEQAEVKLSQALALDPAQPVILTDLGALLRRRGRPRAAVACYRRALALSESAATYSNLGNALRDLGRLAEAETALRRAVALAPDQAGYAYNLALLLRDARQHEEAAALMETLAAAAPDVADYAWDLALTRLYLNDLARGFAGYERRFGLARNPRRTFPGPPWIDEDPAGRTLLVTSEQGFGDALQFIRFVPVLIAQGARVILECQPELIDLFGTIPGLAGLIEKGAAPPPFDLWVPIASLPHRLGLGSRIGIPDQVPYLDPAPAPLPALPPLAPAARLRVGLIWAGKLTPRDRSWSLEALMPLLERPDIAWVSLQKGPRAADVREQGLESVVVDAEALGALNSFADTARLMRTLDLVVTIDTSTAHLAGALGRPVWVLLRYVSDWRWRDEGTTSPWYPTMRLFRQADPDDFAGPVAAMGAAFDALETNR